MAISEAASVLAGQAVRADRDDLVPTVAPLHALGVAVAYGAVFARWYWLWALPALPDSLGMTRRCEDGHNTALYVAAAFQLGDAFNIIARGMLRGTGDVRVPAIICVECFLAGFSPPLTWVFWGTEWGSRSCWRLARTYLRDLLLCGRLILWWRLWKRALAAPAPFGVERSCEPALR